MPNRILVSLFALAACAVAPACALAAAAPLDGWMQKAVARALPPIEPIPQWFEVRGGTWRPALGTVEQMAAAFEEKLKTNASFHRPGQVHAIQFRGENVDDARIVRLLGRCSADRLDRSSLSAAFLVVRDGGNCIFDAEYDPAGQTIRYFKYHAPR